MSALLKLSKGTHFLRHSFKIRQYLSVASTASTTATATTTTARNNTALICRYNSTSTSPKQENASPASSKINTKKLFKVAEQSTEEAKEQVSQDGLMEELTQLHNYITNERSIPKKFVTDILDKVTIEALQMNSNYLKLINGIAFLAPSIKPEEKLEMINQVWSRISAVNDPLYLDISSQTYSTYMRAVCEVVEMQTDKFRSSFDLIGHVNKAIEEMNTKNIQVTPYMQELKFHAYCMYTTFDKENQASVVLDRKKYDVSIQETLSQLNAMKEKNLTINVSVFNSLMLAYTYLGQESEAQNVYNLMKQRNLKANFTTYTHILTYYLCTAKDLNKCDQYVKQMQNVDGYSLMSQRFLYKILYRAVHANVDAALIVDFMKLNFTPNINEFISNRIVDAMLIPLASMPNSTEKSFEIFKFIHQFNTDCCNRLTANDLSQQLKNTDTSGMAIHLQAAKVLESLDVNRKSGHNATINETDAKYVITALLRRYGHILATYESVNDLNSILDLVHANFSAEDYTLILNRAYYTTLSKLQYEKAFRVLTNSKLENATERYFTAPLVQMLNKGDFKLLKQFFDYYLKQPRDIRLYYAITDMELFKENTNFTPQKFSQLSQFLHEYSRSPARLDTNDRAVKRLKAALCASVFSEYTNSLFSLNRLRKEYTVDEFKEVFAKMLERSSASKYTSELLTKPPTKHDTAFVNYAICEKGLTDRLNLLGNTLMNDLLLALNSTPPVSVEAEKIDQSEIEAIKSSTSFQKIDLMLQEFFQKMGLVQRNCTYEYSINWMFKFLEEILLNCFQLSPQAVNSNTKKQFIIEYIVNTYLQNGIKIGYKLQRSNFPRGMNWEKLLANVPMVIDQDVFFTDFQNFNQSFSFADLLNERDERRLQRFYKEVKAAESGLIDFINYKQLPNLKNNNLLEILLSYQVARLFLQCKLGIKKVKKASNVDFLWSKVSANVETLQPETKFSYTNYCCLIRPLIVEGSKLNHVEFKTVLDFISSSAQVPEYLAKPVYEKLIDYYVNSSDAAVNPELQALSEIFEALVRGDNAFNGIVHKFISSNKTLDEKQIRKLTDLAGGSEALKETRYRSIRFTMPGRIIKDFLQGNKFPEAIEYYKNLAGASQDVKTRLLSLNIMNFMIKKEKFVELQQFIDYLTEKFGLKSTINDFFYSLLVNNYNDKAKLLLEQYTNDRKSKFQLSYKRLFLNFYYDLYNNFKNINPVSLLDFVLETKASARNQEDFFYLFFCNNHDSTQELRTKYSEAMSKFENYPRIAANLEANTQNKYKLVYESFLLEMNHGSLDANIDSKFEIKSEKFFDGLSVKDKIRAYELQLKSIDTADVTAKQSSLLAIAGLKDETSSSIKTLKRLSQSQSMKNVNFCRLPLLVAYYNANKMKDFAHDQLLTDDETLLHQYFSYIETTASQVDEASFNYIFTMFKSVADLGGDVYKRLWNSFYNNAASREPRDQVAFAKLFAKYFLIKNYSPQFIALVKHYRLFKGFLPVRDIITEDIKTGNIDRIKVVLEAIGNGNDKLKREIYTQAFAAKFEQIDEVFLNEKQFHGLNGACELELRRICKAKGIDYDQHMQQRKSQQLQQQKQKQ